MHVNWHEAEAYCRWARRRLPSESEWEVAAVALPNAAGGLSERKRRYPWGDAPPSHHHANLDGRNMGCADVAAFPAGDSPWGCRQMIGNLWQWTASDFQPYPGFSPDAYAEYSTPWWGSRKVLRGGAWATRGRVVNAMYRNFFTPDRRDILAGFRTCALD
jgi:iron(II)-dependent oxidoreductase